MSQFYENNTPLMDPSMFKNMSAIQKVRHIENLQHINTPTKDIKAQLGLSRHDLSHLIRISRKLSEPVKNLLLKANLSEGHARALTRLPPDKQDKTARDAIQKRWSVRRIEQEVKFALEGKLYQDDNAYYESLSESISSQIGHPVQVIPHKQDQSIGVIEIKYLGFDSFDSIMQRMRVKLEE